MKKIKTEMSARSQELKNRFKTRSKSTLKNKKFDKIYEEKKFIKLIDDLWKFMGEFVTDTRDDFLDMYEIEEELKSSYKDYITVINTIKSDTLGWTLGDNDRENGNMGFLRVLLGDVNGRHIEYGIDLDELDDDIFYIDDEDYYLDDYGSNRPELAADLQTVFADSSEFSKFVETVKNELPSKLDKYTTEIENIVNNDFEDDRYPNEPDEDDSPNANESIKRLNITKKYFNESNYFKTKYGKLKYVSESGNLYKTDNGHVLKFVK